MKGLKCMTANCEYNQARHCSAGIVAISENGVCKTRIKRKYGLMEQEFANMEAGEEFDYGENEDILIECDSARCEYNKNRRCTQEIVNIGDAVFNAKCKSKKVEQ